MNPNQLEVLRKNNESTRDFVRSCLRLAFMVLLKGNDGEKITVSKLCKIAGVSRMAFYRNYKNVEDVLTDQIQAFADDFLSRFGPNVFENWVAYFAMVDEQKDDLNAIIKAGFEYKILEVFLANVKAKGEEKVDQTIWMSLAHALMLYWLKEGRPSSPEEMARLALKYTGRIPITFVS